MYRPVSDHPVLDRTVANTASLYRVELSTLAGLACGDADMPPPECDSGGHQSATAPMDRWRPEVLLDFTIRRGGFEGGGMSSSMVRVSSGDGYLLLVGVTDVMASFVARSCLRFSLLCAERISSLLKAAHISSDHDLQVLQGVVREQKMPTLFRQDLHDG